MGSRTAASTRLAWRRSGPLVTGALSVEVVMPPHWAYRRSRGSGQLSRERREIARVPGTRSRAAGTAVPHTETVSEQGLRRLAAALGALAVAEVVAAAALCIA